MFKSCFPNSYLRGNPDDPPTTDDNPLRGQECWSENHTVANVKGIYKDRLAYYATRQDKLITAITSPPQVENDTNRTHHTNRNLKAVGSTSSGRTYSCSPLRRMSRFTW